MSASEGTQLALTCCCTNDLLRRRVVAAPTDTDIADKQAEADDVLRAVMRDALLPANDITTIPPPDRDWDRLTVEVDAGAAASVTSRDMSYEALLDISGGGLLTKICKKAKSDNDEELFFDIVPLTITSSGINLIFRAYLGQPGADRAALGLTFSPELGNLTDVKLGYDYTEEVNHVYTGEIGTSNSTNIRPTTDGTQERASNWNSCEAWASDLLDGIDMIKDSWTIRFIGTVTQTEACVFGRDWNWGDRATARFRGFEFNTIIRAVTIQVDDKGKETITARIDSTE
jgi:hypothetical protein